MIKNKRLFLIFAIVLLSLAFINPSRNILAAPSNNPLYATLAFVGEKIDELFNLLDPRISQNESDLDVLEERASSLKEENEDLRSRIEELEENSLPEGKWVHVCFDVATANLFVMKGGTCFPHVHWKIFVQCYAGTPCVPDNPIDTYFIPPQEQ